MKANKLDHICVAVKSIQQARQRWEPVLGKHEPDHEYVDVPEKIKVARYWLGDVGFELIEATSADSEVAKFIERRGEGIMLISFNVDSTRAAVAELTQCDYPVIGGIRPFREGEYAFVHPGEMNGVLLEIIDDHGRDCSDERHSP